MVYSPFIATMIFEMISRNCDISQWRQTADDICLTWWWAAYINDPIVTKEQTLDLCWSWKLCLC